LGPFFESGCVLYAVTIRAKLRDQCR
jgi:hypothetical protein